MDALKLLSRSTKSRTRRQNVPEVTPSTGQSSSPQLFATSNSTSPRKRKREEFVAPSSTNPADGIEFFAENPIGLPGRKATLEVRGLDDAIHDVSETSRRSTVPTLPEDDVRAILREHKIKIVRLNPEPVGAHSKHSRAGGRSGKAAKPALYLQPLQSFQHLTDRYGITRKLASNINDQGYSKPTEVQLSALPVLLDESTPIAQSSDLLHAGAAGAIDLLSIAPTGSGKTLAFMIPILHGVLARRKSDSSTGGSASALILAPTKELVNQIVNEGRKLAMGTGVHVTQVRKGMRLSLAEDATDRQSSTGEPGVSTSEQPITKADVLVSTPGLLCSMFGLGSSSGKHETNDVPENWAVIQNISALSNVQALALDEADVLLDPLFREQTLGIWNSLSHSGLRVSLWSATMGSNIEELTQSTIEARRARLDTAPAPLIRLVVGLKDSAVPNIEHRLVYAATEQGKLMGLRQFLHPAASDKSSATPLLPPFLIFTQTIERAVALHSELLYDIPAEAGGSTRIAVLHADLSDTARDTIMTRFRKGEIWVLITTDLLARGVDFRGVNGVVNYDIPTSSAAYVHRVGRTGRAGREGGVAVTLYSKEDIPYLKHVANVVAMAQKHSGVVKSDSGLQPWLIDSLPKLGKNDKQKFKKRGVESRTSRGEGSDPKAARRARISSKSGFLRKTGNNRKGAIEGSQRRALLESVDEAPAKDADNVEFAGFD
ncbi:hypothetical protein LTR62_007055 [Meristemomyces frigidus]|uniref:ATP-dependent RNA helicase n=1 Tax=Meristemomyces frigidus TaxID=1508187 RepID=A0AAN7YDZ2_9PEZI|nr:hypothetical protein LTR62_007055 [Meristemomyces frigidus]